MKNKIDIDLLSRSDVDKILLNNLELSLNLVEQSFEEKVNGKVIMPDKISQVFDEETQNRTNCLSATLLNQKVSGMKWVSVFPTNYEKKLQNVSGIIVLSSTETGFPLAVIDGTAITAFRTAALGALAVKHLSNQNSNSIGFIGSGEQAQMHFRMINTTRNIKKCYVASKSIESEKRFVEILTKDYPAVEFISCDSNYARATKNADIIITAISAQEPILKAENVKRGATYIHVGGLEDEYAVAQKSDKIICDDWGSVKHRSQTLSRMYIDGYLKDDDIYANLDEIIFNEKNGREHENEIIYFNSVGLAFIDIMFAYEVYRQARELKIGEKYKL